MSSKLTSTIQMGSKKWFVSSYRQTDIIFSEIGSKGEGALPLYTGIILFLPSQQCRGSVAVYSKPASPFSPGGRQTDRQNDDKSDQKKYWMEKYHSRSYFQESCRKKQKHTDHMSLPITETLKGFSVHVIRNQWHVVQLSNSLVFLLSFFVSALLKLSTSCSYFILSVRLWWR